MSLPFYVPQRFRTLRAQYRRSEISIQRALRIGEEAASGVEIFVLPVFKLHRVFGLFSSKFFSAVITSPARHAVKRTRHVPPGNTGNTYSLHMGFLSSLKRKMFAKVPACLILYLINANLRNRRDLGLGPSTPLQK